MTTMVLELKKIESDYETKYNTFYTNSKTEKINNENDIGHIFESIYIKIKNFIEKVWVGLLM